MSDEDAATPPPEEPKPRQRPTAASPTRPSLRKDGEFSKREEKKAPSPAPKKPDKDA